MRKDMDTKRKKKIYLKTKYGKLKLREKEKVTQRQISYNNVRDI